MDTLDGIYHLMQTTNLLKLNSVVVIIISYIHAYLVEFHDQKEHD